MSKINALLKQRFQARMHKLSARVTQRPVDDVGRGIGYLICEVGGVGGVKVMVPPDAVYYPGDSVLVEQRGTPALAFYTVLGWETGARPTAGMIEFTGDTTVGNTTYPAGDLLWGNPYAAHFHMDYDAGQINLKSRDTLTGRVDAATGTFMAGNPTGLHGEFSASGIEFKNATTVLSGWDAVGRTIFGAETLGRPHGPGIQQREIIDPDTGETRYVWQILGLNGVPGVSFITGDDDDPDDYKFYMGPLGASNRLVYENGTLSITGHIESKTGDLGDLTISGNVTVKDTGQITLPGAGGLALTSDGIFFDGSELAYSHKIALNWERSDNTVDTAVYAIEGMADSYLYLVATPRIYGAVNRDARINIEAEGSTGKTGNIYIVARGDGSDDDYASLYLESDGSTPTISVVGQMNMQNFGISNLADTTLGSGNSIYIGGSATEGSWRFTRSGSNLNFERYESGSWIAKGFYTP